MTWLLALTSLLQGGTALTAAMVARRRAEYRPIAVFLAVVAVANLAKMAIRLGVLVPAREAGAVPFTGWVRVASHVESALFLLWMAGLAALALAVYLGRRPWPVAVGWAAAVALLALVFPHARGDELRRLYLAAELAALVVALGSMVQWLITRREPPRLPHVIVAILVAVDLAGLVVGPWRWGLFAGWNLAQVAYCVMYASMIALQLAVVWLMPRGGTGPGEP